MFQKICHTILFFALIFSISSCVTQKKLQIVGQAKLDKVLAEVLDQYHKATDAINLYYDSIRIANNEANSYDSLIIKEADVTFDNVVSNAADGSLSIIVFKSEYVYTKTKETSVKYSLVNANLPSAAKPLYATDDNLNSKNNALAKLIFDAAQSFSQIKYHVSADDKLEKNFEVDVSFCIDQSGNIDVSIPNWTLSPELKVIADVQNTQTMTLIFSIYKRKKTT